jgi:hypothetical protein
MERAITVDLTNSRSRASGIAAMINREEAQRPAFARASQNMAMAATLLDTLHAPSTGGVNKVYHQLKDIIGITAAQLIESSLHCWAEVTISCPGHSKAGWPKAAMEPPAAGTSAFSPA